MAIDYGQDPATLAGIDPRADSWLAWQLRRAVWAFGSWFDRQREATVEKPAPRTQKPTIRVPRYSEGQLRAMLGLEDGDTTAPGPNGGTRRVTDEDLDAAAYALLRGEVG